MKQNISYRYTDNIIIYVSKIILYLMTLSFYNISVIINYTLPLYFSILRY